MKRLWLFCGLAGLLLGSARQPSPAPAAPIQPVAIAEPASVPEPTALAAAPEPPPPPALPEPPPPPPIEEPASTQPAEEEEEELSPWQKREFGGVRMVVSIPQQKAYVFKDGELFGTTPVSTGKRGHETPTGTFRVLQKKVHHRSSKYDNAPMPYMQRLTWYGIALHAGRVPGYPASHGCIRMPRSFAKKLYGITDYSTSVTVTSKRLKSADHALDLA